MLELTLIQQIAVWAIPVLLAVTLHEAAHAYVANRLGDSTARLLGRLSLNPLRHIDLIGTIILPILVAVLSNFHFVFGYAKPVPINFNQLRKPRRDMALVTAAGPGANFLMALLWTLGLKLTLMHPPHALMLQEFLILSSKAGISINLVLAFLNLIPIPPLDGSRIVASILPGPQAYSYMKLEPYGFLIVMLLLFSGLLSVILTPLLNAAYFLLQALLSL